MAAIDAISDQPPTLDAPHAATTDAALSTMGSSPDGLTAAEAAARLMRYGRNEPPAVKRRSALVRFLAHFHNILIYVLLAAAAVTAALDHWIDTAVIIAVVLVNAVIGFVQEGRAEQAMAAIQKMLAPRAAVIRDGRRQTVDSAELAPGDIVQLEPGDRVPADLRLLRASGLRIEEAALTGESVPAEKSIDPVAAEAPLGDRTSTAFSGTSVAAGQGRGVVVATAGRTEIGKISGLLSSVEAVETPLTQQTNAFAKWLTLFILIVAAMILAYGYFVTGFSFIEIFMAVVG
ncbi:MAG: HAD-IC family P-type ATPase, partial [Pseudomonadota bacterium]